MKNQSICEIEANRSGDREDRGDRKTETGAEKTEETSLKSQEDRGREDKRDRRTETGTIVHHCWLCREHNWTLLGKEGANESLICK